MIAIIALILQVLTLGMNNQDASAIVVIPPSYNALANEYDNGCACDDCYWTECFIEAAEEFDALFNATEFKVAKNGRSMVKGANSNTFKFAKKGN